MTFTTVKAHTIQYVNLKMHRYDGGSHPGTITCELYLADGDSKPTGSVLATGTTNGETLGTSPEWRQINFAVPYELAVAKYVLVLKSQQDDPAHPTYWRRDDAGSYATGGMVYTTDQGVSWDTQFTVDFMFEEWGLSPSATSRVIVIP